MGKNKPNESKLMKAALVVVIIAGLALLGNSFNLFETGQASVLTGEDGEPVAPWATKLVSYNLIVSDAFDGSDVNAVVKVYDEEPADWNNPRGDFDDASLYTQYTAAAGTADINKEMPSTKFAVLELAGYNTEFITFTIPNGEGRGDISDYESNPDSALAEMAQIGSTSSEDFAFTLVNDTSSVEKDTVLLTVAENTEYRAWKAIISDIEGFSTDTDGDGTYDEGIESMKVTIGSKTVEVFNPNKGIDLFDSNDEYTMDLTGLEVSDESDVIVKVEITADTSDSVSANDEAWGEGEGILSSIKLYDNEADIFATVSVVA